MKNTVIFDLDGTLLNTLDDLTDSVNFALGEMGYPLHTADEVRMMVGNSVIYLIEQALPDGTDKEIFDKTLALFESHYQTNMRNKTAPYDGVMQMLDKLSTEGYKLAVVSNKPDVFTQELVGELFGNYIPLAIGRSETIARKPAPDMLFKAMKAIGADNCIYVGDSEVDILTAKNAGFPCISVLWGFRDKEDMPDATIFCEKVEELLSCIEISSIIPRGGA